jgi:ubiquinone/menaquinone biosynthesis C-methylase UbiE
MVRGFIQLNTQRGVFSVNCGCGNGQVSIDLISIFNKIEASDINENQLLNSYKHDKKQDRRQRKNYTMAGSGLQHATLRVLSEMIFWKSH